MLSFSASVQAEFLFAFDRKRKKMYNLFLEFFSEQKRTPVYSPVLSRGADKILFINVGGRVHGVY